MRPIPKPRAPTSPTRADDPKALGTKFKLAAFFEVVGEVAALATTDELAESTELAELANDSTGIESPEPDPLGAVVLVAPAVEDLCLRVELGRRGGGRSSVGKLRETGWTR